MRLATGVRLLLVAATMGLLAMTPVHADQTANPDRAARTRSAAVASTPKSARPPAIAKGPSGLLLPRFVSLKSDPINIRKGPGTEYPVAWVYRRAGLPVEIIQEFQGWRQIRDSEGATGWVLHSLLSGRRTALVVPWEAKAKTPSALIKLHPARRASSDAVALLEPGTVASVRACDMAWCEVVIDAYRGYVEQSKLWGVYPNEAVP